MGWRTVIVAAFVLVACGSGVDRAVSSGPASSSPSDLSTPQGAIRAYAEAFLHGTPSSYYAAQSKGCPRPSSDVDVDAYFAQLRSTMEHVLGRKLSDVRVTGAQVRNQTSDRAEAQATFNVGPDLAGNDNWVGLSNESGKWFVSDCGRAPFGGSGQTASASAVN